MYRFDVKKGQKLYYNYQDTLDELEDLKKLESTTCFEDGEKIIIYKRVNGNGKRVNSKTTILPTAYKIEQVLSDVVYEVEWKKLLLEKIDNLSLKIVLLLIPALLIYGIIDTISLPEGLEQFIMFFLYLEWGALISLAIFTPIRVGWGLIFLFLKKEYKKPKIKKVSEFKRVVKIEKFKKYIKDEFYMETGKELDNEVLVERFVSKKKIAKDYVDFLNEYDYIKLNEIVSKVYIKEKEYKINLDEFYGFFGAPKTIVETNEELEDFLTKDEVIIASGDGKILINQHGEVYFWDDKNLLDCTDETANSYKIAETFIAF